MSFFRDLFGPGQPSPPAPRPATPEEREAFRQDLAAFRDRLAMEYRRALCLYEDDVIAPLVGQHAPVLLRKRNTLITRDSYGIVNRERWEQELGYFLTHVVRFTDETSQRVRGLAGPAISHFTFNRPTPGDPNYTGPMPGSPNYRDPEPINLEAMWKEIATHMRGYVDAVLDGYEVSDEGREQATSDAEVSRMTPVEFEEHCAMLVLQSGWTAGVTGRTGDQGIDILAKRDGTTVVVQCKHYSGTIGNSAVQEAIAGKAFVGAQYAAVVTNSSFTRGAQELANAGGVALLHYSELGPYLAGLARSFEA